MVTADTSQTSRSARSKVLSSGSESASITAEPFAARSIAERIVWSATAYAREVTPVSGCGR